MLNKDFVITKEMKQWGGIKDWKAVGEPEILFPPLEKTVSLFQSKNEHEIY
jgi:hypothetical protein